MESKEKKKKDDWVRVASKSRLGRFYMFNKATGETQWLPSKKDGEQDEDKLSISKTMKTPAQDRLKRLQHNLKNSQTRSHSSRTTRNSCEVVTKAKQGRENQISDMQLSSSSSASKERATKSPKKAIKRTQSNDIEKSTKNKSSSSDEVKKLRLSDTFNSITPTTNTLEIGSQGTECLKSLQPDNENKLQNVEENNSTTLNNLRSGIVKKIKEICKMPFNVSKKIIQEKSSDIEEKSCCVINTNQFKPTKKLRETKRMFSKTAKEEIIREIGDTNFKNIVNEPTKSVDFSTPRNLKVPSYPRGSANSRLERLKQSLLFQQHKQTQFSDTINYLETFKEIPNMSSETNNNNNTTTILQLEDDHQHNIPLYHIANNTVVNDEIEAMDWQPIIKDEETTEVSNNEHILEIKKSKKLIIHGNDTNEKTTMGDIYDAVNDNLMRLSAEKQKESVNNNKKWHKDFYYFIVDTNVLLRDLTFVEDLTKMKLCDTKGSMLYIPYSVLQELDKLKMRSGYQEGVKTLAVRAIKYLNSKFESNSPHVQAQSALDERQHLVDINSADDSIMNCCLQAKKHVPNLLLLTEDVNLRNKAICNNILVSTKSDLMSNRNDSSDTYDKS